MNTSELDQEFVDLVVDHMMAKPKTYELKDKYVVSHDCDHAIMIYSDGRIVLPEPEAEMTYDQRKYVKDAYNKLTEIVGDSLRKKRNEIIRKSLTLKE